jgi:Amt family ammonium transporter
MLVTHISAAAGALTWMTMEWQKYGKPSALGLVTGMVAGLATITPASGYVGPGGALIIGIAGGVICFLATNFIKRTLKIDDSLDVFPVHGVGGALGMLATAIFASSSIGLFSGQGLDTTIGDQFVTQLTGVLVVLVYTAIVTWVLLKITEALVGNRVSADEEVGGLDLASHNERGYDM